MHNTIFSILVLLFPFSYNPLAARPRSRLFGSPYPINRNTRSQYEPESRRPASKPFTIPGFRSSYAPMRNMQSNLGFDFGMGGSAFIDPIAGLYDPPIGINDPTVSVLGGVTDLGFGTAAQSRSPIGRTANMQLDQALFEPQTIKLEFVDPVPETIIPGAGFRNLNAMDMNAALNQQLDMNSYAISNGGVIPTQGPFTDQLGGSFQSIQFLDRAGAPQLSMANGLGIQGSNQISGHGAGAVQLEGNQVGLGNSLGMNMNQAGMGSNQVGIDANQVGLGANQVGINSNQFQNGQSQLDLQLTGGQVGLEGLGGNQILMEAGQLQLGNGQVEMLTANQMGLSDNAQILTSGQLTSGLNTLDMGAGQLEVSDNLQGEFHSSFFMNFFFLHYILIYLFSWSGLLRKG